MPYDPRVVEPMREEMVRMGVQELKTVAEVDTALGDQRGTTLVFVNSVCGCAAGNARPASFSRIAAKNSPAPVLATFLSARRIMKNCLPASGGWFRVLASRMMSFAFGVTSTTLSSQR